MARRGPALTGRFQVQVEKTLPCICDDMIAKRCLSSRAELPLK